MDTKEDNQDIQMLKEKLWIRQTTNQDGTPIVLLVRGTLGKAPSHTAV